MTGRQFYDWQTAGGADDVMRMVDALERAELHRCAIGGIAVNHLAAEPMVPQAVDFVVAVDEIDRAVAALAAAGFEAERRACSANFRGRSQPGGLVRTVAAGGIAVEWSGPAPPAVSTQQGDDSAFLAWLLESTAPGIATLPQEDGHPRDGHPYAHGDQAPRPVKLARSHRATKSVIRSSQGRVAACVRWPSAAIA